MGNGYLAVLKAPSPALSFRAHVGPPIAAPSRFLTREGIEIFDVEQGSAVRELHLDFIPDSLIWSPDGQRLAVTSNGYLAIVDAKSGLIQSQPHATWPWRL